jgi:hypothetical protein
MTGGRQVQGKFMKINIYGGCLGIVLLFGFILPVPVDAGEPLDLVKSAGDRVIQVLKDPKLLLPKEKKKERADRLKEIVDPVFDYEEMARRAFDNIGEKIS